MLVVRTGGANGRIVLRVAEEHDPGVADELVKVDGAVGRFGLEVGGNGAQADAVAASVPSSGALWLDGR